MVSAADICAARILVVDDKEDNLRLMEGMLRVAGYTRVESTSDPSAVCDLYERNRYSLILLDLQMPGMDGFAVMEALRKVEADGYLPVIVITAQPSHKLRALAAGARDFLGKPFDMAELRARVRNSIEVRLLHTELRKKNEAELALAEQTQRSLLPHVVPEFENYRIHAFNSPTQYVGGDFYDFLPLSAGEWMGVVADVSGKGISAALLSSMVLGGLSMEFRSGTRPAEVLARLNRLVCERSLDYQYVTMFVFVLNGEGAGQFISAGHNVGYLFHAGTGKIEKLRPEHYAVGMFADAAWQSRPLELGDGDMLVVYSDGLTDAQNGREEMFGETRLLELIRALGPAGIEAVREGLEAAVVSFTEGEPQLDDITFVLVERAVRKATEAARLDGVAESA